MPQPDTIEEAEEMRDREIAEAHLKFQKRVDRLQEREARKSRPRPRKMRVPVEPTEKQAQAWNMRQQGLTLAEISRQIGVSPTAARGLVKRFERGYAKSLGA